MFGKLQSDTGVRVAPPQEYINVRAEYKEDNSVECAPPQISRPVVSLIWRRRSLPRRPRHLTIQPQPDMRVVLRRPAPSLREGGDRRGRLDVCYCVDVTFALALICTCTRAVNSTTL